MEVLSTRQGAEITESWTYNIDIVSACNLRCPTCPAGHTLRQKKDKGMMSLERFEKILVKINSETPNVAYVGLYNWAEPLLHPQLPEFLQTARRHEIRISLSTNLNIGRNLDEIIAALPYSIRISVSGFTQDIYGRTHARGDIEKVKANLIRLRTILEVSHNKIEIHVAYHCYSDNLGDQYEKMRRFCKDLGFYFLPIIAYMMPVEKVLNYYDHGDQALAESDRRILGLLLVHPDEYRKISIKRGLTDCELRSRRTAINWDGSVALCCGVYDDGLNIAPDFLRYDHKELQRLKMNHRFCGQCMSHGLHASALYEGSYSWIRKVRSKGGQRLPKELIRSHLIMESRQRLNRVFGISTVDKFAGTVRRHLFDA